MTEQEHEEFTKRIEAELADAFFGLSGILSTKGTNHD